MSVLVIAEHDGRALKAATRQLVSAASQWEGPVDIFIAGHGIAALAQEAAAIQGVARVLVADAAHLAQQVAEDLAPLILTAGNDHEAIIAAHASFGRNVLPRVAALLDVAMLSDVVAILGPRTYECPMFAGNIHAAVESTDKVQVLTLRASRYTPAPSGGSACIVNLDVPPATPLARVLAVQRNASERPELASARIIVSGGRALGSAERFEATLAPLALKLGAALGATRAAVDSGYAPNDIQVGQTGTIVAPDLYIAIGVSGAVQHLAGIKDSKVIVAINHDPDAAIFQVADYGWVADLFEAVPALIAALNENDEIKT